MSKPSGAALGRPAHDEGQIDGVAGVLQCEGGGNHLGAVYGERAVTAGAGPRSSRQRSSWYRPLPALITLRVKVWAS